MGLSLKELQNVAKNVIRDEKLVESINKELIRVLGPTTLIYRSFEKTAQNVNDRLDIFETTGRTCEQVNPFLLLKFINSESIEVRKLVARLIPESFLKTLMKDADCSVRAAVAKRLPRHLVKEMIKRFPNDNVLFEIEKSKKLHEAGLKASDSDEEFDIYGKAPIANNDDHPGLTDAWYQTQALKLVDQYNQNIDQRWEEIVTIRYASSMRSMGIEVDEVKLIDMIYDVLKAKADSAMLKELACHLRAEEPETLPTILESIDSVTQLVSSKSTTSEYIREFERVFSVRHITSHNPAYLVLSEGPKHIVRPHLAKTPARSIRSIDEQAASIYVAAWNAKQLLKRQKNYKLAWSHDNESINLIEFHTEII